jgi:predicted amidophosphoribosyltransferase
MLEQVFWGRCVVERAAAFSVYNRGSRIRKLIHLLKYQGREDVGRMLGRLYGAVLAGSGFMDGIDRSDILYRTGKSGSQTRRGRYERWENVEGLFAVRKQAEIHGRHLLVVDDVITTGSTIEACVNALHDAGEVSVSVAALAVSQKLTL